MGIFLFGYSSCYTKTIPPPLNMRILSAFGLMTWIFQKWGLGCKATVHHLQNEGDDDRLQTVMSSQPMTRAVWSDLAMACAEHENVLDNTQEVWLWPTIIPVKRLSSKHREKSWKKSVHSSPMNEWKFFGSQFLIILRRAILDCSRSFYDDVDFAQNNRLHNFEYISKASLVKRKHPYEALHGRD